QAEDGIRDRNVTGVQTCALPILTLILVIAALIRGQNVIEMLPFLAMMFIASIPVAMPSTFALSNSFEATRLSKEGVLTSDLTGRSEERRVGKECKCTGETCQ